MRALTSVPRYAILFWDMEDEMADEPRKPRPQSKKRGAPERIVAGVTNNEVELDEEDLKKVTGGGYIGETEKNVK